MMPTKKNRDGSSRSTKIRSLLCSALDKGVLVIIASAFVRLDSKGFDQCFVKSFTASIAIITIAQPMKILRRVELFRFDLKKEAIPIWIKGMKMLPPMALEM